MITFQIVLTSTQIHVLQTIQRENDFLNSIGLKRGEVGKIVEKLNREQFDEYKEIRSDAHSYYVTAGRALSREGLVVWHKDAGPVVTEKGRLVLQLIEMDLDQTKQQIEALTRPKLVAGRVKRGGKK